MASDPSGGKGKRKKAWSVSLFVLRNGDAYVGATPRDAEGRLAVTAFCPQPNNNKCAWLTLTTLAHGLPIYHEQKGSGRAVCRVAPAEWKQVPNG